MEMLAYRQRNPGDPTSLVQVKEEIEPPGTGEVLVRIRATALNYRDLMILQGRYPIPSKPEVIPLSDASGEIIAVGERVARLSVGDRVVNSFYSDWFGGPLKERPVQFATSKDGWLATHKVISAEALSRIPDQLTFEEAAALPCAGVTAWSALSGINAGDTVLTQGSGGVSLFAIQLARVQGARVIATTTNRSKADKLKRVGAHEVIDVATYPAWATVARDLTRGRGIDRIVEVGGPGTLQQSIRAVAYHGQVSLIGALSAGQYDAPIDFKQLFFSQARYECIGVGSRSDLEELIRTMENHALHPVIDSIFAFDEFDKAFEHFSGRNVFGKVIIRHGSD